MWRTLHIWTELSSGTVFPFRFTAGIVFLFFMATKLKNWLMGKIKIKTQRLHWSKSQQGDFTRIPKLNWSLHSVKIIPAFRRLGWGRGSRAVKRSAFFMSACWYDISNAPYTRISQRARYVFLTITNGNLITFHEKIWIGPVEWPGPCQ